MISLKSLQMSYCREERLQDCAVRDPRRHDTVSCSCFVVNFILLSFTDYKTHEKRYFYFIFCLERVKMVLNRFFSAPNHGRAERSTDLETYTSAKKFNTQTSRNGELLNECCSIHNSEASLSFENSCFFQVNRSYTNRRLSRIRRKKGKMRVIRFFCTFC